MRVQVVTHLWPSTSRPESGVFVRDQVEALRRLEHVDVHVRHFPPGKRSYLIAARELRRSRRERFDVVHAHYGLSGWSALAAGRRRLIVTFHGTDLQHPLVGPLSRMLVRLIGLPAAVSGSLARLGVPGAGDSRAVAVLPCGVDVERFRPLDRGESRARLGIDPERPFLLFPSDPARKVKRHDRAVALASHFPEAELLTLRGVPPQDVPLWVNAANAVLVTSDREGFGLATLEALACDVPVLATPVGIAPLALQELDGALCSAYDEKRWLPLLTRHVAAADPRVQGRRRAELFSSVRMAERVLAVYTALVTELRAETTQSVRDGHQRA